MTYNKGAEQYTNPEAADTMLGHGGRHPGFWATLTVRDYVAAIGLIIAATGVYIGVSVQIAIIEERLRVVPAQVQSDVRELNQSMNKAIAALSQKIEVTRVERNEEFRELNRRVNAGEAERAGLRQQVENLNDLMRDIRDLMRRGQLDGHPEPRSKG